MGAIEILVYYLSDYAISVPIRMTIDQRIEVTLLNLCLERGEQIHALDAVRTQKADEPIPCGIFLIKCLCEPRKSVTVSGPL